MHMKMLIVDDEETNRELLEIIFEDEFQLKQVKSGEEALELIPEFIPDIILLDVMMAGIDGYEVCRRIRSNPDYASIIVVMVSACASERERQKGLNAGANEYIIKPFSPIEINKEIHKLLKAK